MLTFKSHFQSRIVFFPYEYPGNDFLILQWDLVCEKDGFVELSLTIFNVGVVTGFFILPPFGDILGRKKVYFICQFLVNAFGIGMAFANNFVAFCALQFVTGMFGAVSI